MAEVQDLQADLDNHHIEGYAVAALNEHRGSPDDAHYSMPLISHIEGNLWVGGCIDGVELPHDFDHVVSLYKWESYELGPDTVRLVITMYDSDEVDVVHVEEAADYVVGCLERGKTLVHCQAGLNRSNLVAARALVKCGLSPEQAVALLREKRDRLVLCNKTFEAYVLGVER